MLGLPVTTCMENGCSPDSRLWCLRWCLVLCCTFFPRDVLDEIWDWIESVPEDFCYLLLYPCFSVPLTPNVWKKNGNGQVRMSTSSSPRATLKGAYREIQQLQTSGKRALRIISRAQTSVTEEPLQHMCLEKRIWQGQQEGDDRSIYIT